MEVAREMLAAKFEAIFPHRDERQRRLLMGAEARAPQGHGGIQLTARAAGVREATLSLGVSELDAEAEPLDPARRPGGGRKRAAEVDPGWSRRCWRHKTITERYYLQPGFKQVLRQEPTVSQWPSAVTATRRTTLANIVNRNLGG